MTFDQKDALNERVIPRVRNLPACGYLMLQGQNFARQLTYQAV